MRNDLITCGPRAGGLSTAEFGGKGGVTPITPTPPDPSPCPDAGPGACALARVLVRPWPKA